ncbi:crotonase/enoyl-CoA hydratase family protein [Orrella marina]|uniref:Enoyl-CoA hydratase n=1 Tax=Orrella marina TaxID=2163011 RepID=A0A2R4XFZ1_9BURK|nr:crotonase/enoyl-CoA hydratase family protein [Orrella marina]AWB32715.1 enoyl-CoA hydratase [Orrella marina]
MYKHIITSADEGIFIIKINRPEVRNAVNHDCAHEMARAFEQLDNDTSLRAAILTGTDEVFSTGMDLKAFASTRSRPHVEGRGFGGLAEKPPAKPLIAAVEGYALAGGFEMVLACDLIVASSVARFGLPEVKRGLVAGSGGMLRLPRRLPYHIAMELILTGDQITAERAAEFGLINRLCEPGTALRTSIELARRIVENAPLALHIAKKIVNEGLDWPQSEMFERQRPLKTFVSSSKDALEGARAFAEKRKPVWRGE